MLKIVLLNVECYLEKNIYSLFVEIVRVFVTLSLEDWNFNSLDLNFKNLHLLKKLQ